MLRPRTFAFLIVAVLLAGLPGCVAATPTPAPTLTALASPPPSPAPCITPSPLPTCALMALPTPGPGAAWSPDGARFATSDRGIAIEVVDPGRGLVFHRIAANGVGFWRWTADSRFAVFRYQHPHGNAITYVFDAQAWALVVETPGCRVVQGGSLLLWEACGEYPIALSPTEPAFLMENGRLARLPGFEQSDILAPWWTGDGQVIFAAWSWDGAYLAVIANTVGQPDYALFLTSGDGTQARRVAALEGFPRTLEWARVGMSVTVDTDACHYVLDAPTGELQVWRP